MFVNNPDKWRKQNVPIGLRIYIFTVSTEADDLGAPTV